MQLKQLTLCIITSLTSSAVICQQTPYKPTRYDRFITETIAGLEAKKTMLEKKIQSSKERLEQALKKQQTATQSPARAAQYRTIIDASRAVMEGLDAAHQHVLGQLKRANEEKVNLPKLNITNTQDEDRSLQKAKLTLSIADLQQQIQETRRAEKFLEKQKPNKTDVELKSLTTLMSNWAAKRSQLETKLRSEQGALQSLK